MGLFKPGVSSKAHKASRAEPRSASYRAVEIRCSEDACEAAKAERGKRYLSKDAPMLPLSGCDKRDRCACRYRHHEDRRGKEDRRGTSAPAIGKRAETERRSKASRRAEDNLDDPTVTEAQIDLDDTYYGFRRR
jgi:hypothetical protein